MRVLEAPKGKNPSEISMGPMREIEVTSKGVTESQVRERGGSEIFGRKTVKEASGTIERLPKFSKIGKTSKAKRNHSEQKIERFKG